MLFVRPGGKIIVNSDMAGGFGVEVGANCIVPDTSISYSAMLAKEYGWDVGIFDGYIHDHEYLAKITGECRYQYIFIQVCAPNIMECLEFVEKLHDFDIKGDVFLYGPAAVLVRDYVFGRMPNVKGVLVAELEKVVYDICLENGQNHIHFNGSDNLKCDSHSRFLDLTHIKSCFFQEESIGKYRWGDYPRVASIYTSKGCDNMCSYCPYSWNGDTVRYRKIDDVLSDFLNMNRLDIKYVIIKDQQFGYDRNYLVELLNGLVKMNNKCSWWCETSISNVNPSLLPLMSKAGCKKITFGIESASADMLNNYNRIQKVGYPDMKEIIKSIKKNNICASGMFMLGFPNDTVENIKSTVDLALQLGLDEFKFSVYVPYPARSFCYSRFDMLPNEILLLNDRKASAGTENLSCETINSYYKSVSNVSLYWKLINKELSKIN